MVEGFAVVAIVASITQLIDLTSKVIARLDEFHSRYGETPKSLKHMKAELPILTATLEQAKAAIKDQKSNKNAALLLPAIQNCTELIEELNTYLERLLPKATDSRTTRVLKSLDSLRQDDKIDRIVHTLHSYVSVLTFYYAAASSSLEPLTDKNLVAIRQWLAAPDPSANYHRASKLRQAGTGLWFLESKEYSLWKSKSGWIWLHGIPGCGKTILSSTILEDVFQFTSNDPGKAVAYFYFDFKDPSKQESASMVRSLISQLSQQSIQMSVSLETLHESCGHGSQRPLLDGLLGVLKHMLLEHPQTYIVLDALDECADRAALIDVLEQISKWQALSSGLSVLLTSRNEKDLRDSFVEFIDNESILCIQSKVVDYDILLYVTHRLETDRTLRKWVKDDVTRQEIEDALREGARGMFRWAVCQLDTLGKCRSRQQLREALLDLPSTLDETYNRILLSIENRDREYAMRILLWLTFARRQLSVAEIAEVAAYDLRRNPVIARDDILEDPQDILNICSSLITVSTSDEYETYQMGSEDQGFRKSSVALAHYSVQEYLLSERIRTSTASMFSLDTIASNNFIGKICLHYLLQFEQHAKLTKENINNFALLKYSTNFWIDHASRSAEPDEDLVKLIVTLFDQNRVPWLVWRSNFKSYSYPRWSGSVDARHYGLADTIRWVRTLDPSITDAILSEYSQQITDEALAKVLHLAIQHQDLHLAQVALTAQAVYKPHRGISVTVDDTMKELVDRTNDGRFPRKQDMDLMLAYSCMTENHAIAQYLVEHGANVNAQIPNLKSKVLHEAEEVPETDPETLLDADVHHKTQQRCHVVLPAPVEGVGQMARLLLNENRSFCIHWVRGLLVNPLQAACSTQPEWERWQRRFDPCNHARYEIVRLLVRHGADINAQGGHYGNALQAACSFPNVYSLTRSREEILLFKDDGEDCAYCTQEGIKLLLSKGAEINAEGGYYGTALQAACWRASKEVVELLLNEGSNTNIQGGRFGTALVAATVRGAVDVVKLLLDKGVDVHARVEYEGKVMNAHQVAESCALDGGLEWRPWVVDEYEEIQQLLFDRGARAEGVET